MKKEKSSYLLTLIISFFFCSCGIHSSEWFTTHRTDRFYQWTLTSRLGQALEFAEKRYGPRDLTWTILGVEIYDEMAPQTWYLNQDQGQKQIIIRLGRLNTWSEKSALFALSHEVIHTLSPVINRNTVTVFEEGLAVYFSIQYLKAVGLAINPETYIKNDKYKAAYDQVSKLYGRFENADEKIKALRKQAEGFSSITTEQFQIAFPGFDNGFYERLAGKINPTT